MGKVNISPECDLAGFLKVLVNSLLTSGIGQQPYVLLANWQHVVRAGHADFLSGHSTVRTHTGPTIDFRNNFGLKQREARHHCHGSFQGFQKYGCHFASLAFHFFTSYRRWARRRSSSVMAGVSHRTCRPHAPGHILCWQDNSGCDRCSRSPAHHSKLHSVCCFSPLPFCRCVSGPDINISPCILWKDTKFG